MKPSDVRQDFDFLWTDDLLPVPTSLASKVEELFKVNDDLGRLLTMDTRRHWVEFRFHLSPTGSWLAAALPLIEVRKWTPNQALLLLQALDAFNRTGELTAEEVEMISRSEVEGDGNLLRDIPEVEG